MRSSLMTKIKDRLLDLVEQAKPAVIEKVTDILDDLIFPWYEVHSPHGMTSKALRVLVAEKIASTISYNLWVSREETLELSEVPIEGINCSPFVVVGVFPQNTSASGYDLMVTLSQKAHPANMVTMSMHQLMQDFYPLREVSFSEYNS